MTAPVVPAGRLTAIGEVLQASALHVSGPVLLPMPSWPYDRLERWHYLSFLNTAKNLEMLERLQRTALIPERLLPLPHPRALPPARPRLRTRTPRQVRAPRRIAARAD